MTQDLPTYNPMSQDVINAVVVLTTLYRQSYVIPEWKPLDKKQVEEILEDVRKAIYKFEGVYPIPKK